MVLQMSEKDVFVLLINQRDRALQAAHNVIGKDRQACHAAAVVAYHYACQIDDERWTVKAPAGQVSRRAIA